MLSTLRKAVLAATISLSITAPDLAQAGVATPLPAPVNDGMAMPGIELAASKHYVRPGLKPGCRASYCRPGYKWAKYKKWQRKKYFGRLVAGVALGAIIVTAANATPRRPSSNLCWYWANSARTRGYWDYCY